MNRPWQYLYNHNWRKASKAYLRRNPLCVYCLQTGKSKGARVVDHIVPHKGDRALFWDIDNWQGLCKRCHDSVKATEEARGYAPGCDADGMPIDSKHPWNK